MSASVIAGHGVTKITLAVLCVVAAGALTYFVLLPFVDIISASCEAAVPYLGCKNMPEFFGFTLGALHLIFWPFIGFRWLVGKSYFFISSTLALLLMFIVTGSWLLKRNYDLHHAEPSI